MNRRSLLSALLTAIAVLFRAVARAEEKSDAASMYARVEEADSSKGTALLKLSVMPSKIDLRLQGDVKGLSAGDWIDFHLQENAIDWKGRRIGLVGIVITP